MSAVIEVDGLRKTYRTPLRRRRVEAVSGIRFDVQKGEIFGFLGPNGAGKTTTIRVLMGLIFPTAGSAKIFGHPVPSREARARLGFLPEAPYFYEYLNLRELLDLAGRLFGMSARVRAERAEELCRLVGLEEARDKPLKSYSKGMLQRAGLAQALINDPELVVLDEPMGGLDPVGRKEVRDIILGLRDRGKTVFFSSHILADVEAMADRIAIIARGRIREVGTLQELVGDAVVRTDVVLRCPEKVEFPGDDTPNVLDRRRTGDEVHISLAPAADVDAFLAGARDAGVRVVSVVPHRQTLEDVFMKRASREEEAA